MTPADRASEALRLWRGGFVGLDALVRGACEQSAEDEREAVLRYVASAAVPLDELVERIARGEHRRRP